MSNFPNLYGLDNQGRLIEVSTGREVSIEDIRAAAAQIKKSFNINSEEAAILPKGKKGRPLPLPQVDPSKGFHLPPRKKARPYDRFEVRYLKRIGNEDVEFVYAFSLLPAIDTTLRTSGQGVPDATPGIRFQTEMNYQRHLIPGAPPVYQSMGIKGRYVYLVGTFLGVEKNVTGVTTLRPKPSLLDIKISEDDKVRPPVCSARPNSYETSKVFDEDIIQNGRPVELVIFSDSDRTDESLYLRIYGVIESMRLFCVRADRTYYALTVSSLQFQWGPKVSEIPQVEEKKKTLEELLDLLIKPINPKKRTEELLRQLEKLNRDKQFQSSPEKKKTLEELLDLLIKPIDPQKRTEELLRQLENLKQFQWSPEEKKTLEELLDLLIKSIDPQERTEELLRQLEKLKQFQWSPEEKKTLEELLDLLIKSIDPQERTEELLRQLETLTSKSDKK